MMRSIAPVAGLTMVVVVLAVGVSLGSDGRERVHAGLAQSSSVVQPGATMQLLATGFTFTEGPAPDRNGGLYFTDVFESRLHHWSPEGGATLVREDTNRLNGLAFDDQWRLLGCEWYGQRVVRMVPGGLPVVVAATFAGKPLNGPNDVWVAPDGAAYFTDPTFGEPPNGFQQDGAYVYRLPPDGGDAMRVSDAMQLPNGLVGTRDGKTLYVTDSRRPTWRYDIGDDGSLGGKVMFADIGGDGMTLDEQGNVYLASQYHVYVFDPTGQLLERIAPPEPPANVAFGGEDGRTLFVTAQTSLYSIRMAVRGEYAPPDTGTPAATTASPAATTATTASTTVSPSATTTATASPATPMPPARYVPFGARNAG